MRPFSLAMRTVALSAAALAAPSAQAMGLGTTGYFAGDIGVGAVRWGGGQWLPSLDLHPSPELSIQLHALDTLAFLTAGTDTIFLGGDLNFLVWSGAGPGGFEGVVEPGGSLDLYLDDGDVGVVIGGSCRFGFRGGDAQMLGLYLVPAVGVAAGEVGDDIVYGGALQLSLWFPGAG
jgi:hypothetical protein